MILHKYTSQINRSKYPQQTARKIANDLNKNDPFNNYLVSFELGSKLDNISSSKSNASPLSPTLSIFLRVSSCISSSLKNIVR